MSQQEQRLAVVHEACTWIGTAYHHHGRVKGVGVDCAQLLCAVFEACRLVPHVDPGTYPVGWHLHRHEEMFSAWLAKYAKPATGPVLPGDVLLFKYGRTFSHGAICIDDGLVVHSYVRLGVIVSRLTDDPLQGRDTQHWSFW